MKKYRFFLALLFVSLLYVLLPTTVKAAMWDVPVAPGETFRWVFVTSTTTDATSSNIDDYNGFVDAVADAADGPITNLAGFDNWAEIDWLAIGSTETTHAIDNIGISTSGIYTPMGDFVADGTMDLFSNSDAPYAAISTTEQGETRKVKVWTGATSDGTRDSLYYLGVPWYEHYVTLGISNMPGPHDDWIRFLTADQTLEYPMYAISEELTVVPVPGALILAATGLLSSTFGLKRLRRKHQE